MDDFAVPRKTYGQQLEHMIREREVQLMPLNSGHMHVAYRLDVMGAEWVDNTEAHAQKLRTEIADMQAIADHLGKDGGESSGTMTFA